MHGSTRAANFRHLVKPRINTQLWLRLACQLEAAGAGATAGSSSCGSEVLLTHHGLRLSCAAAKLRVSSSPAVQVVMQGFGLRDLGLPLTLPGRLFGALAGREDYEDELYFPDSKVGALLLLLRTSACVRVRSSCVCMCCCCYYVPSAQGARIYAACQL